MKDLGRNDPCWCKSGRKYKKCHLDRERQEIANPWDAVAANKRAFHAKKCYAQDAGLGPCEGQIIKAHTVSRGPNLSRIAQNGKVIRYNANPTQLTKTGGKLTASLIGIGDASVFLGFCAGHDRELFSCIENEAFSGRPDQCLAIAYRTLSREFYGKDAASHLRETLREADRGRSPIEQVRLQSFLDLIYKGNELAKKDLRPTHERLTTAMAEGGCSILCSLVIEFEHPLPFMLAGAWSPFTDFYGNELQDGLSHEPLQQIFVSSFAGDRNSHICLSWMDRSDAPGKIIADQIRNLSCELQASACLQFALKHVENLFYNPDWFDELSQDQRKQLDTLAASGLDVVGSIPSAEIKLNLAFDLPRASL